MTEFHNPLRRFNNHVETYVASHLLPKQAQRVSLAVKSMRGQKIISPQDQSWVLQKKFSPGMISELSQNVDAVLDSTKGEFKIGNKILEIEPFQQALDGKYRSLQVKNPDQQIAFDYWIKNSTELPKNQRIPIPNSIKKTWRWVKKGLGEAVISGKLLTMLGGIELQQCPWLLKNIGNFMIEAPLVWQAIMDTRDITSTDKNYDAKIEQVILRYGLSPDNLAITHRDKLIAMRNASAIFVGGEKVDLYLGYGSQGLLWSSFLLPEVRNIILPHQELLLPSLIGFTFTIAGLRTILNTILLNNKKIGYSSDFVGTSLFTVSSLAAETINHKAGKLSRGGNAFISSVIGTLAYLTYQITAHTLPFTVLGIEASLAVWAANVVDELYWTGVSGVIKASQKT